MVYRKGELQSDGIDRGWPHHIALHTPNGHLTNYQQIHDFCRDLNLCPRNHAVGEWATYHTIFCFAEADHARRFQERFGGFVVEPNGKARRAITEKVRAEHAREKSSPR